MCKDQILEYRCKITAKIQGVQCILRSQLYFIIILSFYFHILHYISLLQLHMQKNSISQKMCKIKITYAFFIITSILYCIWLETFFMSFDLIIEDKVVFKDIITDAPILPKFVKKYNLITILLCHGLFVTSHYSAELQ